MRIAAAIMIFGFLIMLMVLTSIVCLPIIGIKWLICKMVGVPFDEQPYRRRYESAHNQNW